MIEKYKPISKLQKRSYGSKSKKRKQLDEITEGKQAGLSGYYAPWQVEPYDPGEAKDGKVPRNEFGNVYLYSDDMLPKGCTYIVGKPKLHLLAKKLEIDCARAVTGWVYLYISFILAPW